MARHNDLGKWGENIACEKLLSEGYYILERNWRLHHYEVDIIAQKDNHIIFIEVKTRSDANINPLEAIDNRKIRHLVTSANAYMKHAKCFFEYRFDVIGISGTPDNFSIEHIPDAFYPPLKTYN